MVQMRAAGEATGKLVVLPRGATSSAGRSRMGAAV
jgi:hypothetical protein